jgi:hypothetical protein
MAHVCDNCGYRFERASKEMLGGCPECGGNKFQYRPHDDAAIIDSSPTTVTPSTSEEAAQKAARSDIVEADDDTEYTGSTAELVAGLQNVDQNEEVADSDTENTPDSEREATPPPVREEPDYERMDALREELNDQFESIKILEPGTYELNLERLVERDEYIIQIYQDGRYAIQIPERHMGRTERSE